MTTPSKAVKQELKVYVKMHDGSRLMGLFYLGEFERLQDVMNDDRSFLPLHVFYEKGNKTQTVMLAKRYIEQVEEFDAQINAPVSAPVASRSSDVSGLVERRKVDLSELSLDDAHFSLKRSTDEPGKVV
jgi:hypothetical protein